MTLKRQRLREPVLGYRTKTEAIFALRLKGMSVRQIADAIGGDCSNEQVRALLWHADRNNACGKYRMAQIEIPERMLSNLRPAAAKRDIDAETLVLRLLATCIEENMIDNILDDGDE